MKADVFGEDSGPSPASAAGQPDRFEPEVMPSTAIESLERAQVDVQIATAKKYPRAIQRSMNKARQLACESTEIASGCAYALPRDHKVIKGPTIRLAEIMAISWGNLTYGGRVLEVGARVVVAQGVCTDMENNVRAAVEAHRGITYAPKPGEQYGERYGDALIQTTSQAAIAVAIRNAIFKVIPGGYVLSVYRDAQKVARGEDEGLEKRRDKAMTYFAGQGVAESRVYAALSKQATRGAPCTGKEDITWNDIDVLIAFVTSIKTGEATIDDLFPQVRTVVENAKDGTYGFGSNAVPESGARKQASILIAVVFPAPLGPRKPRTSPFPTSNDKESTARIGPKLRLNCFALIIIFSLKSLAGADCNVR